MEVIFMVKNRSVPTDHILPHVYYENVADALAWLTSVFGFVEDYHFNLPDGQLHGVMIHKGNAWVMLKNSGRTMTSPSRLGLQTQSLMVFVKNVDEHYRNSISSGARILEEIFNTEYGERQYSAQDLEGHVWTFSEHVKDVSPVSWGGKIANERTESTKK
ncbi:MAG: glyoxalase [Bacillota bacterium]|nr:glyoxalase [Bacillota bacterium]